MNAAVCAVLAVLSIWDYPSRQPQHDRLRRQLVEAVRGGDNEAMIETCRKGVELLPDDPTWHYNLACSLAYLKRKDECLDELEKAIDLGFRDVDRIRKDSDLRQLSGNRRFDDLLEYARDMSGRPILMGPMATIAATGVFGRSVALGAQNFGWNFDYGCFEAKLQLVAGSAGGNVGDLYMNRDHLHSPNGRQALDAFLADYPGLTCVTLDREGRERGMDLDVPNMLFPYPVFGNCSRAMVSGPYWRSHPRSLMTTSLWRLKTMAKFYLSNQIWVFPSNADTPPVGTNGDVFASVAPYWLTTAGRSWSDQHYLRAALEASRSMDKAAKEEAVKRGLLAPTIQMLIRKSLVSVTNETDYLGPKAHPTALPPGGVDFARLRGGAAALKAGAIPPLAVVTVDADPPSAKPTWPELTYATGFAWAFVLRAEDPVRTFTLTARGSDEYAFAVVHDDLGAASLERLAPSRARVTVDRRRMSVTNRVDVAVFGKSAVSAWGAPSYVSFAVVDPSAPYSDPALTPAAPPGGDGRE